MSTQPDTPYNISPEQRTSPKLYLLTNDDDFALLYRKLKIALATGTIGLLQIRRKRLLATENGAASLYQEAVKIVALAKQYHTPVVINDDTALAAKLGVGVHLGQGDGSVAAAKQQLLPDQIVGRTCHGDIELVRQAQADGADYAAMGAIFASKTKPNAQTVDQETLIKGCQQAANSGMDICVIGGLSVDNVRQLQGLPIGYVAVVGDIMNVDASDVAARCYEWQQALSDW